MSEVVADLTHLKAMVTTAEERAAIGEIETMIPKYTVPFGKLMAKTGEKHVALGETVASANDVENAVKASSADQAAKTAMLLDLNLVRRHEKNFQTRGDLNANADVSRNDEYTAGMSNGVVSLKAHVSTLAITQSEKSVINSELDSYLANFLRYHDLAADTDVITADDGDMVQYGREIVEATDVLTGIANDKSHETAASARTAIIAFVLVAIAVGAGIAFFLTRAIKKPLEELMTGANKIKDGDFGYDIKVDSNDELGDLARAFQEMNAGMEQLASGSMEVADGSQKLSELAQVTARDIEEVATEINQTSVSASKSADKAQDAVHVSHEVQEAAKKTLDGLAQIQESVAKTSETVSGMNTAIDQVGDMGAVITDVADQTNMLGLNASIEAARAGEAGRGFAVVADAVKNLAEKVKEAAGESAVAIGQIQDSGENAISATGTAVDESAKGGAAA
jgi:X-X-X-Leu-X-X-Gly heptad repeat protein